MNRNETIVPLVARLLLAAIFLQSGFSKLANPAATEGFMASVHMPAVGFFLYAAAAAEIGGALALIFGFHARIGAATLFLFLIPATLLFHNFWAVTGMQHQMQMMNFMKNLGILGGLAMVVAYGPGLLSVDARRLRREESGASAARTVATA